MSVLITKQSFYPQFQNVTQGDVISGDEDDYTVALIVNLGDPNSGVPIVYEGDGNWAGLLSNPYPSYPAEEGDSYYTNEDGKVTVINGNPDWSTNRRKYETVKNNGEVAYASSEGRFDVGDARFLNWCDWEVGYHQEWNEELESWVTVPDDFWTATRTSYSHASYRWTNLVNRAVEIKCNKSSTRTTITASTVDSGNYSLYGNVSGNGILIKHGANGRKAYRKA